MPYKRSRPKIFPSAKDDLEHAQPASIEEEKSIQAASSAYRLAYDDMEFMLSDEMRPVRLLLELSKPESGFQKHNIEHTIVMFGSARTPSPDVAKAKLQEVQKQLLNDPDNTALNAQLKKAQADHRNSIYYDQARLLAKYVTCHSGLTGLPDVHVITGGGPGIMEAANRGATESGGVSIGLNIVLPKEQCPNPYITPELCFRFHYFAMRKMHFLLRARALIIFPGGYGTLDELFDTLTLVQTGKIEPLPILIFGRDFWHRLIDFEFLAEESMISQKDLQWFRYVDTAEEAWQIIKEHLNS